MEKTFPDAVTRILRVILSVIVLMLGIVDLVAVIKVIYGLALMILTDSIVVPYEFAEQIVIFFLYFGFLSLIVQYFKSKYHFPLRFFIYSGITAMLRLIIVDHASSVDTILFAGAILLMVIALCLVHYSDKLKNV